MDSNDKLKETDIKMVHVIILMTLKSLILIIL